MQASQQTTFQQPYDPYSGMGGPQQEVSVKAKLVNLIGAVRTLMRGACYTMDRNTYVLGKS